MNDKNSGKRIVFDLSLSYALCGEVPSGVPRTQRKLSLFFMEHGNREVRFCRLDREKGCYYEIAPGQVERIGRNLRPGITEKPRKMKFHPGDVLVISEAIWDEEHHRLILKARNQHRLKLVYLSYDIIPVLYPQYLMNQKVCRAFEKYVMGMLLNADQILCISEATRMDLIRFARSVNIPVNPERMSVIHLGTDVIDRVPITPAPKLMKFADTKFVLMVSTIEPRKNHELIYNVWHRLGENHGSNSFHILFVGGGGWGNTESLIQKILTDPYVVNTIHIIDDAKDDDLHWLYENCFFTVFPSFYEGWGLPVSESLAYGKYCVSSSTSSLPEAGQGLTGLIDPLDFVSWYTEIEKNLLNPGLLLPLENKIRNEYKKTTWNHCAQQVLDELHPVLSRSTDEGGVAL